MSTLQKPCYQTALQLLHLAERLKCTLRHGWTTTGRQESVAEHSWRLALMVMVFYRDLEEPIDLSRALQMAIIHDLAESITGDVPFFEAIEGSPEKTKKNLAEAVAMEQIRAAFNIPCSGNIFSLWQEYQLGESVEARFVHALDKIEAQIQQNEADISTWNDYEKQSIYSYLDKFCDYDKAMKALKATVRKESIECLQNSRPIETLLKKL